MIPRPIGALLGVFLLALSACGTPGEPTGDEPSPDASATPGGDELHLVATTSIIGDILDNVVGEAARVEVLMPPGTDPHQFEVSPGQARGLRIADLVVANGLELEVRLTDVLGAAEREGARIHELFAAIDDPLELDGDHGHDDQGDDEHAHDDDHAHGEWDPHVWFDPLRAASAVRELGEVLDEVDVSREPGVWSERAAAYAAEIESVHLEIERILDAIPDERRRLVTNHEAFGYLADRYDLDVVGVIVPGGATLAEPTAREFRDLAALVEELDVPAIFAETTAPTRLAEALANEVGRDVEVVVLYSESLGEPGSGAETYLGMLRVNAQRIAEALSVS